MLCHHLRLILAQGSFGVSNQGLIFEMEHIGPFTNTVALGHPEKYTAGKNKSFSVTEKFSSRDCLREEMEPRSMDVVLLRGLSGWRDAMQRTSSVRQARLGKTQT